VSALGERVFAGDVAAAARVCRIVDDRLPGHEQLLSELYPRTGRAWVVGVTGSPGSGKSTLCDRLIQALRAEAARVGVIAIDPTSPFSGGAILGDRIRMQRHFEDPEVFIRSVATRGALGGLSRSTADLMRVLDAWGADVVLVETVGVGQDELEVTRAAHTTLVVMAPGLGDDIQAIKAGILEVADVFAVNKADADGADATVRDLELMIALGRESFAALRGRGHSVGQSGRSLAPAHLAAGAPAPAAGERWTPPIVKTIATHGQGVSELVAKLREHRGWLESTPEGQARRSERLRLQLISFLKDALAEAAVSALGDAVEEAVRRVEAREIDPYTACAALIERFRH
jgi:LAO/AO transport system kinase